MKRHLLVAAVIVGLLLCCAALNLPAAEGRYHVIDRLALPGEGGWDYVTVDTTGNRIFVARSTRVMVLQRDTGKLITEIPGTARVHGVALARDYGRGFITNGGTGEIQVFDLATLQVTGKIAAGKNPDAILYDAKEGRVFAFNGDSHDVTVIDAATTKAIGTIKLSGKPEFAVQDSAGWIYVNIEDQNSTEVIDPHLLKVVHQWPLGACEEPTGLAIDRKRGRLFAACGNKLMSVLDTANGRLLGSVPIGEGCDGVAFDPVASHAFAANGEGTLTVVAETEPGKFGVLDTIPTQTGGRTIGFDESTRRLLIPAAKFGPGNPAAPSAQRPAILPGTFELLVISR